MAEYLSLFPRGASITFAVSADVTGGQLVELTTARAVGPAAAESEKVVGVAAFDAKAGEQVAVLHGEVERLKASGAITVGAKVGADAAGTVKVGNTPAIGIALTAAADGALVEVKWI